MLQENQNMELVLIKDLGMLFPNETSKEKKRFGIYKCYCGNEFKSMIQSVKRGSTKSCGCYNKQRVIDRSTTHGLRNHRLYTIWNDIIQRCNNQKNKKYNDYGRRGITVCERWLKIENFIEDMYPTYKDGLTIDRIDNNKGYNKDNCRWTTKSVQQRNTRIIRANNTSGYRGVSFHKKANKYHTRITVNSKAIYIGLFKTAIEAAKAYNDYVISNKLEHTLNIINNYKRN